MRTPSKSTLPIEPLGTALGTARGVALTARDKGLELLDSDAAHELLRRGQHVAIVARDRGADLLDSDAAQEIMRRGKDVVSAAKGDLVKAPTKSRRPLGMMLFAAGSLAGIAAAVASKRMSTRLPDAGIPPYDDPAANFPQKDGVIDLTSVAAEEGVTSAESTPETEIGTATKLTKDAAQPPKTSSATSTPAKPAKAPASAKPSTSTSSTTSGSNGSPAGSPS